MVVYTIIWSTLWLTGQDMLLWALRSMEMYFLSNYLQKGDLTTRQISSGGGNKGVVDLWMFKKDIASYILSICWTSMWRMLILGRLSD